MVSISAGVFSNCQSLTSIAIPSSITSIPNNVFGSCYSCGVFDFSTHQTVPTCQSNSFASINSNAKIIVPDALYSDWIAASNWSDLASQIVKASEA